MCLIVGKKGTQTTAVCINVKYVFTLLMGFIWAIKGKLSPRFILILMAAGLYMYKHVTWLKGNSNLFFLAFCTVFVINTS